MSATAVVADAPTVSVERALGVPTRAGIYRRLRTEGRPATAREVSEMFGLHPNVARSHLDTLADAGLVVTGRRKHPGGGRPAKVYVAREQSGSRPPDASRSGGQIAVAVLAELAHESPEAVSRVEQLAETRGRRLVRVTGGRAGRRGFDAAVVVAVEAMREAFPEVRVASSDEQSAVIEGLDIGLRALGEVDGEFGDAVARGLVRGSLMAAGAAARVTSNRGRVRVELDASAGTDPHPVETVDARGHTYQAGVVATMRAIMSLDPGECLEVLTDTEGAPAAFARWADRAGHEVADVARVRDLDGREAVRLLVRKATP